MSKITDIYDNLRTLTATALTGYIELPEVYSLGANPSVLLNKAYAIGYGSETNDQRYICNILTLSRSFQILLVNKLTTTINNTDQRRALEKAVIDDGYTLIKALMNDITLSEVAVDARYQGQSGIEYLTDDNGTEQFLTINLDVSIAYQETY